MIVGAQQLYPVTGASLLSERWDIKMFFVMLETQVCVTPSMKHFLFSKRSCTVLVNTPSGRAPPLVTGTFGGADFLHSLMGEATEYVCI